MINIKALLILLVLGLLQNCTFHVSNLSYENKSLQNYTKENPIDAWGFDFHTRKRRIEYNLSLKIISNAVGEVFHKGYGENDTVLSARYFPLNSTRFKPYFGGGVGYYDYHFTVTRERLSNCTGVYVRICEVRQDSQRTHLQTGFFTQGIIGLETRVDRQYRLLFEFRQDFDKGGPLDLRATTFLLGIRKNLF